MRQKELAGAHGAMSSSLPQPQLVASDNTVARDDLWGDLGDALADVTSTSVDLGANPPGQCPGGEPRLAVSEVSSRIGRVSEGTLVGRPPGWDGAQYRTEGCPPTSLAAFPKPANFDQYG